MTYLSGSPYSIDPTIGARIWEAVIELNQRVELMRSACVLTDETLQKYYGRKRFEQVAESNAIEGNTLSVGETELAVLKGVTITGHDPAYSRDAVSLDKALQRVAELARTPNPTDIAQVKELHELILGDTPGAGIFRNQRVLISGSKHTPPKTWEQIMAAMEEWQQWSKENCELPAVIRAVVLHAWFVHIHPFLDGNGRCARAIVNLELFRSGYPPIIIRKKERDRYIDALAKSDEAGDLSDFFDLVISRTEDALRGLEQAAKEEQGYDPRIEMVRKAQKRRLEIWLASVSLLVRMLAFELEELVEPLDAKIQVKAFDNALELEDYVTLCSGKSVPMSWAFKISVRVPALTPIEKLAWFGHRSGEMYRYLNDREEGGPSLFWSIKNPQGYPPWIKDVERAPGWIELTTIQGHGDQWFVMDVQHTISASTTSDIAKGIAHDLLKEMERAQ